MITANQLHTHTHTQHTPSIAFQYVDTTKADDIVLVPCASACDYVEQCFSHLPTIKWAALYGLSLSLVAYHRHKLSAIHFITRAIHSAHSTVNQIDNTQAINA